MNHFCRLCIVIVALAVGIAMHGCMFGTSDTTEEHSLVGKWAFQDHNSQDVNKVKVTTYQYEFLANGKLKGFVSVRMDEDGRSITLTHDTLGDSSRYEADAVRPGWLRMFGDVFPGGGICPCLMEGWYRYEVNENVLRLSVVGAYEGPSSTLVGTWRREYHSKVNDGGTRYVADVREFSADDSVTVRLFYPQEAGSDTTVIVRSYVDSGSFFLLPTSSPIRQYYRIAFGRLFIEQGDTTGLFSTDFQRVTD
jgi:hypothetical protein